MRFADAIASQGRNLRQSRPVVAAGIGEVDLDRWRSGCLALTGMGASSHALLAVVPALLEGGRPALTVPADELAGVAVAGFVDSVVAASQVGTSTETLEALTAAGSLPRLVITNDPESPVARLADAVVPLGLLEDSAVYTLGYTATVQALGLLATALAQELPDGSWDALPDVVEQSLEESRAIVGPLAGRLQIPRAVDLVASGAHRAAANEGALLLRESVALPTASHSLRQYLHGPMEALGDGFLVVVIGEGRAIRLAYDVARTGARVLLLTTADVAPADNLTVVRLPVLDAAQLAVLEILPIQLLANEMAAQQGLEVQGFRYEQADTKVVGPAGTRTGTTMGEARRGSIGIDVGGSKLAVALTWGHTGNLEFYDAVTTPIVGGAEVLRAGERLVERALEVARRQQITVSGIGVAVPEVVGLDGRILSQVVVPDLDAGEWRRRLDGIAPITVESDVRAGAKAEAVSGAARARRSFCYLTVGTGISYALVLNGVVQTGARGAAIQLGNSVAAEWYVDGSRREWILEEIASGPAMLARYLELGGGLAASPEEILRAFGREQSATRAVEEAARSFGIGVALLVNLLDPELVVVGGGLGSAPGPFWEGSVASARDHIWCDAARGLPILQAELGPRSQAVGAAIVAFGGGDP